MVRQLSSQHGRRIALLLAGLTAGQFVLYGPSLIGRKILLPLDLLAQPATYLPSTPDYAKIEPQNLVLRDQIDLFEPARRFAVSEFHAGRLPMWAPYQFAGVPFIWPKFSPFLAFECCTESPIILAWGQLLTALVAGLGAYFFCRRVLGVSFWPATMIAWCYPLTAFFVLWQGFPTSGPVVWLPWILWAVDETVRGRHRLAPVGLAVLTGLVLASGHLDVAGQVLLVAGMYALWALWGAHRDSLTEAATGALPHRASHIGICVMRLLCGVFLGFMLAAPYMLPVLEYTRTGVRMTRRGAGELERPPIGVAALPEVVLPHIYGSSHTGSVRLDEQQTESETSAAGYAGVVAALFAAPLAFASRPRRSRNLFWVFLAVIGMAWSLRLPGFVTMLRLPGLNLMSHNRLVFATAFAVLALAAVGLEMLVQGHFGWQRWWWAPTVLLAGMMVWCVYRTFNLPEPITGELENSIREGQRLGWLQNLQGVRRVQDWFVVHSAGAAVLCGLGVAGWLWLRWRPSWHVGLFAAAGLLLWAELIWFSWGRAMQCDPALYYPPVSALTQLAQYPRGRVIGYRCLPASLASMAGLNDVRGYDGVDPSRVIELLGLTSDGWSKGYSYALTQWLAPKVKFTPEGQLRLPPILDMLGVRYVIFRHPPPAPARPALHDQDYWVMVNDHALPRAYVPQHVECIPNSDARLRKLSSPDFNPRELAVVESDVILPAQCRGSVEITSENPTHLVLALRMEGSGLVVIADHWDRGWRAYLSGKPVPLLRVNHALRGVVAPNGNSTLELGYQPVSFVWGIRASWVAGAILLLWSGLILRQRAKVRGGRSADD